MNTAEPAADIAFAPLTCTDATILILGSMPGVASLQVQQYYAHPRNAFWFIIHDLFGNGEAPVSYSDKTSLLQQANVALWDVLQQCIRPGSLDSNIDAASAVCNDFSKFLQTHQHIEKIAFNGKTAEQLFRKRVLPKLPAAACVKMISLPSTSPAMAALSKEQKATQWRRGLLS